MEIAGAVQKRQQHPPGPAAQFENFRTERGNPPPVKGNVIREDRVGVVVLGGADARVPGSQPSFPTAGYFHSQPFKEALSLASVSYSNTTAMPLRRASFGEVVW